MRMVTSNEARQKIGAWHKDPSDKIFLIMKIFYQLFWSEEWIGGRGTA
jgi:hypothetical protein